MNFYGHNLLAFIAINCCLTYVLNRRNGSTTTKDHDGGEARELVPKSTDAIIWQFKKRFLPVYLLVFGADWLQGPYIYTMYKDEKGLAEETVAQLFTTGFAAAAISASFVGALADRHGRKAACLFFCVSYSLSCFTILFDSIYILFAGRILGGLSTTLMYSVFESWMVTEYHRQNLEEAGGSLSDLFGLMTTLNGVVAIFAGLFAQGIADMTGTQAAPFMTAVICLIMAFGLISKRWGENYGDDANTESLNPAAPEKGDSRSNGFRYIMNDRRLWALCLTSCCFEGSMYLWIFFKFPALKLSHQEAGLGTDLPFGTIFAALMCAMMLGSLFFTYYSSLTESRWVGKPSTLLMITLSVASGCFIVPVLTHSEALTFWCFCIFEVCCGIYFPSMAHLKEKIVDDGVRAKIYGIMRVPLNLFVVVGLMLTKDGLRHRENVFIFCSGALIIAAAALGSLIPE